MSKEKQILQLRIKGQRTFEKRCDLKAPVGGIR